MHTHVFSIYHNTLTSTMNKPSTGRGHSHFKRSGMLPILPRVVNRGFWSWSLCVFASWLVLRILERAVRVQALTGDIVLRSWARQFTLTVPLSTQVYKWVPANLMLGVTLRWTSIPSRGEYKYS